MKKKKRKQIEAFRGVFFLEHGPHKDGRGHLHLWDSCYHMAVKLSHRHYYRFCYRDCDNRTRY